MEYKAKVSANVLWEVHPRAVREGRGMRGKKKVKQMKGDVLLK